MALVKVERKTKQPLNSLKTICIADDSADDVMLLKLALRSCGHSNLIVEVSDGAELVCYLKGEGKFTDRATYPLPGLLFLDLRMPAVDGFQVLDWLGKHPELRRQMTVAVLSHFSELKDTTRAYQLGADTFISKPLSQSELRQFQAHYPGAF